MGRNFRIAPFITLYSFTHLVVDAACAYLLLGVLTLNDHIILSLLLYNAIAFVLQAPFGLMIDKVLSPKLSAILGVVLIAASYLFWNTIFIALIMVSIGNALYHVGGGSLVLSLKDKKATFSGIYIAPGGIGLALGSFLSISQLNVGLLFFPSILVVLGLLLCFVATPGFIRVNKTKGISNGGILMILLIMMIIAIRSLIGLSVEFPWKENQFLYIWLISAIALGKVFGGILSDKYGLMKTGVGGLLISMPLLAFFPSIPVLGILGAFLFNFTMPVTLIAIWNILPQYKGLSFGLTTVALFIGSIPVIIGRDSWLNNNWVVFFFIFLASVILFTVLRFVKTLNR
ncbi:MAG: hypothetical protein LBQ60_07695 [Bacteroidales bacterium]|nr:hypothetical protein [Bacteroidales bacterium]